MIVRLITRGKEDIWNEVEKKNIEVSLDFLLTANNAINLIASCFIAVET